MPEMATGFDLMPKAVLDQHFLKRNRLSRLMAAISSNPGLIGYGIDEDTAILVYDKEYKVIGSSYVIRVESKDGKMQIDAYEDGEAMPINK